MKQFLLAQFNNYNQATVDKFQAKMVDPLPTFNAPNAWEPDTNVWGHEPEGFWYTNRNQTYFFENNGTVHTLGTVYKPDYYEMYKILYQENKKNPTCNVIIPLEISVETLTAVDHPCGIPTGSDIYYMKFETPNGEYGQNVMAKLDLNFDGKLYLQNYINQLIDVFFVFRRINLAVVPKVDLNNFFVGPSGNFFMFVEVWGQYDINHKIHGMSRVLIEIQGTIEKFSNYMSDRLEKNFIELTDDDKKELLAGARNKFYALILREDLPATISKLSNSVGYQLTNTISRLSKILDCDVTNLEKEMSSIDKILPADLMSEEIRDIDSMLQEIKEKWRHLAN
jgi:hypothetical protein